MAYVDEGIDRFRGRREPKCCSRCQVCRTTSPRRLETGARSWQNACKAWVPPLGGKLFLLGLRVDVVGFKCALKAIRKSQIALRRGARFHRAELTPPNDALASRGKIWSDLDCDRRASDRGRRR